MSLLELIREALHLVWEWIKKIWVKVLNWKNNIVDWFKEPSRLRKVSESKKKLAISIKENLQDGNFNVINSLYDEENSELVDYTENTIAIGASELDSESALNFGDKEMILLS